MRESTPVERILDLADAILEEAGIPWLQPWGVPSREVAPGVQLEPHMVPTVTELVDSMRSGMGKVTCDNIPALDTWIHAREETLKSQMDGMRHKKQVPWHEIDSVFRTMLDSEA